MEDLKQYQLNCFLSPSLDEAGIKQLVEKLRLEIESRQGKMAEEKNLRAAVRKRLAYPIKKFAEGFYLDLDFSFLPDLIGNLKKQLNLEQNLLRYLVIAKHKEKTKPAPTFQPAVRKQPAKIETVPFSIVEKIEPMIAEQPKKETKTAEKRKAKIEELDRKLEEILNE